MCISGPPCCPGKTLRSIAAANSCRHRIIPARGPRSVLCVVVVTTCACGTGEGCTPPATSPAKCAISTIRYAPTLSAICRIRAKVELPRIGAAAADDHLRLLAHGGRLQLVVVDRLGVAPHLIANDAIELAGKVELVAVRQMPAMRQVEAQDRVARRSAASCRPPRWPASRSAAARSRAPRRTAAWRGRAPGSPPRRQTRIRRSSACPDSPRHTCW